MKFQKQYFGFIALLWILGCTNAAEQKPTQTAKEVKAQVVEKIQTTSKLAEGVDLENEPIQPLAMPTDLDFNKVQLGKKLYFDTRLSGDNSISCASCHALEKGGTDLLPVSIGINNTKGPINSPTVYNSGYNFAQFWDGRAKDLAEQAEGPVHNPLEMGSNWEQVIAKLEKDESYPQEFQNIYQDGLTGKNIADAIAEFERSLVTVNSRFDKYLKGNANALTALEVQGYNNFKDWGCVACHNGPNVGGNSYQKFGLIKDYFADKKKAGKEITEADLGRYNVSKDENDKHKFKVPSLRVVALTPPYFHDASANTLEEAVKTMAYYQLGFEMDEETLKSIVAFLKTLPGEYERKPLLQK